MIDDRDLQYALGAWFREPTDLPDDFHEVLRQLPSTPQKRGWPPPIATGRMHEMLGATKFVVGGLVVALIGGLALAGVLMTGPTQESPAQVLTSPSPNAAVPSPTVTSPTPAATENPSPTPSLGRDLLPGVDLRTREIEPGVYRVDSDGYRELRSRPIVTDDHLDNHSLGRIVTGLDGSVWQLWRDRFIRLGDPREHRWLPDQNPQRHDDIAVGPDGLLWHPGVALRSYDGTRWRDELRLPEDERVYVGQGIDEVEILPDGTVWAGFNTYADEIWESPPSPTAARRGPDGWAEPERPLDFSREDIEDLVVTPEGTVYLTTKRQTRGSATKGERIWRVDGDVDDVSQAMWELADSPIPRSQRLAAAPDGSLWAAVYGSTIAHYDGEGWTYFDEDDGVPHLLPGALGRSSAWSVGLDGSLWFNGSETKGASDCHGILDFDGESWRRYLDGLCVYSLDVATDGSVWLRAGKWHDKKEPSTAKTVHTYVIRPEEAE